MATDKLPKVVKRTRTDAQRAAAAHYNTINPMRASTSTGIVIQGRGPSPSGSWWTGLSRDEFTRQRRAEQDRMAQSSFSRTGNGAVKGDH
jgi:hypothetical protein